MKKIVVLIIILAVAITGYFAAGPFITIHKIKSGIINQDTEKISAQVDFPVLRNNLKEQFNAIIMQKTKADLEGNPFASLGVAFAKKLIDSMVDAFITPTALTDLLGGKRPEKRNSTEGTKETDKKKPEPFKDARYTYDSLNKFSAWVKIDKDEEHRFIFTRNGLTWKLSNIQLPQNYFEGKSSVDTESRLAGKSADLPEESSVSEGNIKMYYELQEKCGKQSREMFREEFGNGIVYKNEQKITSDYTNHYNKKLNKCFLLVNLINHIKNRENKIEKNRLKMLFDLHERKEYGAVLIFDNGELDSCSILDQICKSEQEWDLLVKHYMEE